jgi:hypothetical protein
MFDYDSDSDSDSESNTNPWSSSLIKSCKIGSTNKDIALNLLDRSCSYLRENLIVPKKINRDCAFYKASRSECPYCGNGERQYVLFLCEDRWYVLEHWTGCMTDEMTYNHWSYKDHFEAMRKYINLK